MTAGPLVRRDGRRGSRAGGRMPRRITCTSGTQPDPYTMALGPVDTGRRNPMEAPMQAPKAGCMGSTPAAWATAMATAVNNGVMPSAVRAWKIPARPSPTQRASP
ncbi:MAG: hypothetical protein KF791_07400 [Verrucomicrobiae bacterium]|nr:hypothetical protein [Verrucomicrobiae bacterium]